MVMATRRRDGITRITIRVEAHLTVNKAAAAVVLGSLEDSETISYAGRQLMLKWMRNGVLYAGTDIVATEDMDAYGDEYQAALERLVEVGIFPEQHSNGTPPNGAALTSSPAFRRGRMSTRFMVTPSRATVSAHGMVATYHHREQDEVHSGHEHRCRTGQSW